MTRHTTFRYCLDPTSEQRRVLVRNAGASRFAFNQCLRMVKDALSAPTSASGKVVPWSGFDLINAFNRWKTTDAAGRTFAVDADGVIEIRVTGLAWRTEVCQRVFEEAAVDCGRALAAWADSRAGKRSGRRVGFPRFKRKNTTIPSFRVRNRHRNGIRQAIRIAEDRSRSVTVPGLGAIRVHDDTRPLRRLLAKDRARVRFATVSCRAGRWWVSLNVEAAELHSARRHGARPSSDHGGWVGVDRGLSAFLVAASSDGRRLTASLIRQGRWPAASNANVVLQDRSHANKRARGTATRPRRNCVGIIIVFATFAGISSTGSPASWSRLTTGSSSKI